MALLAVIAASFAFPTGPRIPVTTGVMPEGQAYLASPPLLRPLAQWDGSPYLDVAAYGYSYPEAAAYFPLYPLLVRALALGHIEWLIVAAILVSLVAAAVASVLIYRVVSIDRPHLAWPALVLLLLWPGSLFLTAAYSEALVLALFAATALLARARRWWLAGAMGALAAAARPTGLAMVALIAIEYALAERRLRPAALAVLLPFAGLAAYAAYLGATMGDPLAFVHAQQGWQRGFGASPASALEGVPPERILTSASIWSWLAALGLSLWSMRTLRPSYGAAAALLLLAGPLTGTFQSSIRHAALAWPAFVAAASLVAAPRALASAAAALAMMLALYAVLFTHGYQIF